MNQLHTLSRHECVLYNDALIGRISHELFEPKLDSINPNEQGRGQVYLFQHQEINLVLRHCRRGGLIGRIIDDNYVFIGLRRTRMWREFLLLQALQALKLPVPIAVAVRCIKTSPFTYRGDLITQTIMNSQTVAQVLKQGPMSDELWALLGCVIARFHQHHVYHADLNANNILLDQDGQFYLIDFDRGRFKDPMSGTAWRQKNLDRLLRSFNKLAKLNAITYFSPQHWQLLLNAYHKSL